MFQGLLLESFDSLPESLLRPIALQYGHGYVNARIESEQPVNSHVKSSWKFVGNEPFLAIVRCCRQFVIRSLGHEVLVDGAFVINFLCTPIVKNYDTVCGECLYKWTPPQSRTLYLTRCYARRTSLQNVGHGPSALCLVLIYQWLSAIRYYLFLSKPFADERRYITLFGLIAARFCLFHQIESRIQLLTLKWVGVSRLSVESVVTAGLLPNSSGKTRLYESGLTSLKGNIHVHPSAIISVTFVSCDNSALFTQK